MRDSTTGTASGSECSVVPRASSGAPEAGSARLDAPSRALAEAVGGDELALAGLLRLVESLVCPLEEGDRVVV